MCELKIQVQATTAIVEKRSGLFIPLQRSFPLKRSLAVIERLGMEIKWPFWRLLKRFKPDERKPQLNCQYDTDEEEFGELNELDLQCPFDYKKKEKIVIHLILLKIKEVLYNFMSFKIPTA